MRRLTGIPRQRIATHGDFADSAIMSQRLKDALGCSMKFASLSDAHTEALQMIMFKVARIVCGDPDHPDHWDDVAGYAQLARRACKPRWPRYRGKKSR